MNPNCLAPFAVLLLFACKNIQQNNDKPSLEKTPAGCAPSRMSDSDWYHSGKAAPLFKGLEGVDFKISTSSKEAQAYFNQGLMLAYAFNHAEAARSFYQASRLDSNCAMAYWGYAYVLGPNYNGGMDKDNLQHAYEATRKALTLSKNSTAREKALIEALSARYAASDTVERKLLDLAYAGAMRNVYKAYTTDPDIGALYAEALMDMHPWDLYEKDTKKERPWTPEILSVLEDLKQLHPGHPGAHHFYVHALEASATPEKALKSAKVLETLVPAAGHLAHMPSHIYINTGDYHAGSLANLSAIKVDSAYTTACHAQGVYPLAYYPHNYHFLAATATMEGNSKLAWLAANQLRQHTATDIMLEPGWGTLQHYYTILYYISVKFGMWDTILALPALPKELVYPRVILHYARGMAYLGKQDLPHAQEEMNKLKVLSADTILGQLTVWDINTTADLVQIATRVLAAEIAARQQRLADAIALLTEAVRIEDRLNYNEPPDWFFSVRHHLGAILLNAGKFKEAEKVYRQDLLVWKRNGWALSGLHYSLTKQQRHNDAHLVKLRLDSAWQYADVKLNASLVAVK